MEEKEQEGIELETINPNSDIVLPQIEDENEEVENTESEIVEKEENNIVTEKEKSLQKGVNEERRKRKEAEKKARDLEARVLALEEANKTPEKSTLEELIEKGVDESIAKSIASAIDKKSNTDSKTKQELANLKFEVALTKKSKEEGFEDILDYADEIKELVDKGLTLEQSYYATTYDRTSDTANTKSEIEKKLEVKMQNSQARKEILGNLSNKSGTGNSSKAKINATATEKAIAAAAGMSVEDYVAIRDMDSVKDYNSYKAKKK